MTADTQTITPEVVRKRRPGRPSKAHSIIRQAEIVKDAAANPAKSVHQLARDHDVTRETVQAALDKYGLKYDEIQEYKKNRAEILAGKQRDILNAMDGKKLKDASVRDLTIAYGTLYDKERLETGQSTVNQAVITRIAEKLDQEETAKTKTTQS